MTLRELKQTEIQQYLLPYLSNHMVQSMNTYIQHGNTTTLQHCISVAQGSCALANRLHLQINYRNLAVGALLHDFYLYDWHTQSPEGMLHGFSHPYIACHNALLYFQVNSEVQHIIMSHMWPLTLRCTPRSKEAALVCVVDKYYSTIETLAGICFAVRLLFCRH